MDRLVGNEDWHHIFSHTYVEYLLRWGSDHRPILVRFLSKEKQNRRSFKFDKRWMSKEGFREVVQADWESSAVDGNANLYEKITRTRRAISKWKRKNPSNNEILIAELKEKLDKAQADDSISSEEELELKWKLWAAYREEEIISKILSSRLKRILPSIVSETQSAFVTNRLITDNIFVAQEIFHALRTNQTCKEKFVAIKTDMSKAYDRVEWSFMEALLLKFGFDAQWVQLIMKCVSSVSYQVLINGEAKGHIKPSRGLRQGDPLSPFLFILCTEVLISHIKKAEEMKKLTGIKVARESPAISHLLFADDSLFFCRAEQSQCEELV